MLNYRRNFLGAGFAWMICLFTGGCTEEIFDAESAKGAYKIINTGHNYGKNVPNAAVNLTQLLSFSKNPDNTYTYYDAGGILDNQADNYGVLNRTQIDQNGSLVSFNALKRQRELKGETGQEVQDPTIIAPPVTGYAIDRGTTGSLLNLVQFFGATHANNSLQIFSFGTFSVEVQFGPGKSQKAYRYKQPSIYSYPNEYVYKDYVDVPFEVWDVTNNRQLMVAFNDQQEDGAFNLIPLFCCSGPEEDQSHEYLMITGNVYSDQPDPSLAETGGINNFLAYFIWPVLAPGATWNAASIPDSKLTINKTISEHYKFYPFPMAAEAMFSVNQARDEVALLSLSRSSPTGELKSLAILDGTLSAKGKAIQNNLFGDFIGLRATSDGGAIACYSFDYNYYPDYYPVAKITKVTSDMSVEFDVRFNLWDLPGIEAFYATYPRVSTIYFFEQDGRYFFFYYYTLSSGYYHPGPDLIQIYEVNASGINKIKEVLAPEINNPEYGFNSGIQDVIAYNDGYALLTFYGNVYFLDNSFNLVSSMVSLPGLKEGLLYRSFHLYPGLSTVYFSGATPDNPGGDLDCPDCPAKDAGQLAQFSIGSVETSGNVRRKAHDLGGRIFQCRSVFNDDGSAAHIALVETSPRAREVLFFKTDKDFNVIK